MSAEGNMPPPYKTPENIYGSALITSLPSSGRSCAALALVDAVSLPVLPVAIVRLRLESPLEETSMIRPFGIVVDLFQAVFDALEAKLSSFEARLGALEES